jgi:hypothetical protein
MANTIKSFTNPVIGTGTYDGELPVDNAALYSVGSTVIISPAQPGNDFWPNMTAVIRGIRGQSLVLGSVDGTSILDLSRYQLDNGSGFCYNVTQLANASPAYGCFPGFPGNVLYGSFGVAARAADVHAPGPDSGSAVVGDIYFTNAATTATQGLMWICTTAGVNAPLFPSSYSAGEAVVVGQQRTGATYMYRAVTAGTSTVTPTDATVGGTSTVGGVTWLNLGVIAGASVFAKVVLT